VQSSKHNKGGFGKITKRDTCSEISPRKLSGGPGRTGTIHPIIPSNHQEYTYILIRYSQTFDLIVTTTIGRLTSSPDHRIRCLRNSVVVRFMLSFVVSAMSLRNLNFNFPLSFAINVRHPAVPRRICQNLPYKGIFCVFHRKSCLPCPPFFTFCNGQIVVFLACCLDIEKSRSFSRHLQSW
jgi:hypothetical protein